MKNWISPKIKLPPLKKYVLCIVKSSCSCEHYNPAILSREELNNDWHWVSNVIDKDNKYLITSKDTVMAWKSVDKFPEKYSMGIYQ